VLEAHAASLAAAFSSSKMFSGFQKIFLKFLIIFFQNLQKRFC
jgi:hypothetical protein